MSSPFQNGRKQEVPITMCFVLLGALLFNKSCPEERNVEPDMNAH